MYFGSVRFFKDLLRFLTVMVVLALIAVSVVFIVKYNKEKNISQQAMKNYSEFSDTINIPDGTDIKEIYAALKDKGYSAQDILNAVSENDPELIEDLYKERYKTYGVDTSAEYTKLYPDLYVTLPKEFKKADKTIYLTFDDGPSEETLSILSILEKYDIKATFFLCGSETEQGKAIIKKIADEGHSIGIHSYSHDYNKIYQSPEAFLEDMAKTSKLIEDASGIKPDIYRFPGGSINNYNRSIYMQLIAEITRRGYVYYDWDVSGQDASDSANWTSIYRNVTNGVKSRDSSIILLHSTKERTVTVLEDLIIELKNEGYSFDKITNETTPSTFGYKN